METITSVNNARIKDVANLKQKKFRTERGVFFAEGLRAVTEAVRYGDVTDLFFTRSEEGRLDEIIKTAEEKGAGLYQVDDKVMAKLSDTKTPQGVLAVLSMPENDLRQLKPEAIVKKYGRCVDNDLDERGKKQSRFRSNVLDEYGKPQSKKAIMPEKDFDNNAPVVILDRIQDPGNLGTIIRTVDAAGALGLILLEDCVDAFSPKVVRASMGSLFHLPVVQEISPEEALTWCYRNGYEPAATALKGAANLYKTDLSKKMAYILGNEANGVSEELQAAAETRLFIPMEGMAESMNVAIAAGIILFEGLRQRKFSR